MIWAIKDEQKIEATPKEKAICPLCNEEVISKCGRINVWHWAHKSDFECDSFGEPETEWHKQWKNYFPKEQQEFTMGVHRADIRTKDRWIIELQNSNISPEKIIERENYYKRMLWLLNGKTLCKGLNLREKNNIITFRWKNPLKSYWYSEKEIYIDLDGIVNLMSQKIKNYISNKSIHSSPIKEDIYYEYYTPEAEHIEFSYPRTEYIEDTKEEIIRLKNKVKLLKNKLFLIKKIYKKIPCGGWGVLINKEDFLKRYGNN